MDTPLREEHGPRRRRGSFEAEIIFNLSRDEAEILAKAIRPEAEDIPSKRVSVEIEALDRGLRLRIRAVDLTALRAALNSFIRFVDAALTSMRKVSSQHSIGNSS